MKKNIYVLLSVLVIFVIYAILSINSFINAVPTNKEFEKYIINNNCNMSEEDIIYDLEIGVQVKANQTFEGDTTSTYDNPIIPKGFAPINTEDSKWENVKEDYINGMVIEDRTYSQTNGSQFVWIPVIVLENENFEDVFIRTDSMSEKIEYDYYEAFPNQVKPQELEEPIKTEINEIYNSIKKNGGFYIARYEAGTLKEYPIIDGTEKAVSLPNVKVWNNIPWGGSYKDKASDGFLGDDIKDGAVTVSRSMYLDCNVGVKSNLIYGVQWDAVIKFIGNDNLIDYNENVEIRKNLELTGNHKVKNIYDLDGNVSEWTMEASSVGRIIRGGNYKISESLNTPQLRYSYNLPDITSSEIGFRVALYII